MSGRATCLVMAIVVRCGHGDSRLSFVLCTTAMAVVNVSWRSSILVLMKISIALAVRLLSCRYVYDPLSYLGGGVSGLLLTICICGLFVVILWMMLVALLADLLLRMRTLRLVRFLRVTRACRAGLTWPVLLCVGSSIEICLAIAVGWGSG